MLYNGGCTYHYLLLQMGNSGREVKELAQGHTAGHWEENLYRLSHKPAAPPLDHAGS